MNIDKKRLIPFSKIISEHIQNEDNKKGFEKAYEQFRLENAEELVKELSAELKKVREELSITQEQLANAIGTKRSNVSRVEKGKQNMSLNYLFKTAKALGKEVEITLK